MAEDKSSKTEEPTAKKRDESRKKGQVPKSMELNSVAVLLAGLIILALTSRLLYSQLSGLMAQTMSHAAQIPMENDDFMLFIGAKLREIIVILTPIFITVFSAALLMNLIQVGPIFTLETMKVKLSKLDPIKGFGRIFSVKSLVELFKSIAKIVIIASTAYFTVVGELETIIGLGQLEPVEIGGFAVKMAFAIFLKTCWLMIILALIDLVFQKWQHQQDIKMSKEEVKEEHKQTEGDPHVRARIRSVQREMAQGRMMAAVPEADVVITNPVHLALALKYDAAETDAPVVLAKGQSLIAEKIKEIAKAYDIPVVENKPLARGLYNSVKIGEIIPVDFYQAVADVLAFVYQAKGKVING